ncbi:unnamed protein product [Schistocephalus solidus]|uniref:Ferric-chelate reductase 1 n=1 Tax=Schistocephalus solidus TaxID=70667 RepID=A0A3P7CG39_SCHSO|nr:unnamed protein product [Schistocephalus solidus]
MAPCSADLGCCSTRNKMLSLIFAFIFVSSARGAFQEIDLTNCGVTKGCLRPSVCADDHCEYAATWRLIDQDSVDYIEFELLGDVKSSDGFVTLVFSKDRHFGGDGFVGCYYDTYNMKTVVRAGYRPEASISNQLVSVDDDPTLLVTEGENLGGEYSEVKQQLQCRFRRRVTPVRLSDRLKDLAPPNAYFLMIQRGSDPLGSAFGSLYPGGEAVSKENAVVTSPLYGVRIEDQMRASGVAKAHGCMMVLAWVFCSSVGVILSRYYKDMWPNSGLLGERVWFQLHRILMGVCVGLTCIAVILAFAFCYGYSTLSSYPDYIHPILGLIVLCLAFINPLTSFCRCHPNSKHRPYFNWIHFFIGTFAHCLSIPTMMLGLRLPAAGVHLRTLNYPLWILIFFVIFQFIVEITLEIHGCIFYRRNKSKLKAVPAPETPVPHSSLPCPVASSYRAIRLVFPPNPLLIFNYLKLFHFCGFLA